MKKVFLVLALILLVVGALIFFCWFTWLERFVVYTRDNEAILDLEFNANEMVGEVAQPPSSGGTGITIYYNEGDNAVEVTNEMTQDAVAAGAEVRQQIVPVHELRLGKIFQQKCFSVCHIRRLECIQLKLS